MTTTIATTTPDLLGSLKDAESRVHQRDRARQRYLDHARSRTTFAQYISTQVPSAGARAVAQALTDPAPPRWLANARVGRLLCAIPKIGATKAARMAYDAGVDASERLLGLDETQRLGLAAQLETFARRVNDAPPVRHASTDAQQIQRALDRANQRRIARAALLSTIRDQPSRDAGCEAAASLLRSCRGGDAAGLRLMAVLERIPRVGETLARAILDHHQLSSTVTLAALSPRRRDTLARFLLGEEPVTIRDLWSQCIGRPRSIELADVAANDDDVTAFANATGRLVLVD